MLRNIIWNTFVLLFSCFSIGAKANYEGDNSPAIINFSKAAPELYRTGELTPGDIIELANNYGVKTIVSLELYSADYEKLNAKVASAAQNNIKFFHFPLDSAGNLERETVMQVLKMMESVERPLVFHWNGESEQSGVGGATYGLSESRSVFSESVRNWSPSDLKKSFKIWLESLRKYYRKKIHPKRRPSFPNSMGPYSQPYPGHTSTWPYPAPCPGDTPTGPYPAPCPGDTSTEPGADPCPGDSSTEPNTEPCPGDTSSEPSTEPNSGDPSDEPSVEPEPNPPAEPTRVPPSIPPVMESLPEYTKDIVTKIQLSQNDHYKEKVGKLVVQNTYRDSGIKIVLYHAAVAPLSAENDTATVSFGTWPLQAESDEVFQYQNQPLYLGIDWGIQIVFGNGVKSAIKPIAAVKREFKDGTLYVDAEKIYSTKEWVKP